MKNQNQKQTDWNSYYNKPYKLAGYTKGIITRRLLKCLTRYAPVDTPFSLLEFGGGNSCFYDIFQHTFQPSKYYIVDNNQTGLDQFSLRVGSRDNTVLLNRDILSLDLDLSCDVVFSIGLIEHFSPEDTRKAILSHFQILKKGGILVLGFPTPTFLYRIVRKISEWLGLWIFHDERPLSVTEVESVAGSYGEILESKIIWPIGLTQAMMVIRKNK